MNSLPNSVVEKRSDPDLLNAIRAAAMLDDLFYRIVEEIEEGKPNGTESLGSK